LVSQAVAVSFSGLPRDTSSGVIVWCLLVGAAFLAGGLNAIAGGGTFLTFPALVLTGTTPLAANATSTVALWPGSVASAWGYRSVMNEGRGSLVALIVVSLGGGLAGALLALATPGQTFEKIVPFLVLFAAVLFTVGERLRVWLSTLGETPRWLVVAAQLPISLYGGYLGGGIGLLMLAALTLLGGGRDMHRLNGLKSVLGLAINLSATMVFVGSGLVDWPKALAMAVASTIGGYVAARSSLRLDARVVKRFVVILGWLMTLVFFVKTFVWR
jgi:uncharacterized protein